jgi:hypothetical protein
MSSLRPRGTGLRLDENGKRIHRQGRYFKYWEKTVNMRVPKSMIDEIDKFLKERMEEMYRNGEL